MPISSLKRNLARKAFEVRGIQRIHIVGCSRSGTTMLHLAMSYFKNALLSSDETDIEAPYLSERLRLLWQTRRLQGPIAYISKRNYGWSQPDNLERLVEQTRAEGIGIIHIVRDPRDVMTSVHAGKRDQGAYVSPKHWRDSVNAGIRVMESLGDYSRKLEIRYEDVVKRPDETARLIGLAFGLEPSSGARSFAMVQDNVRNNGSDIHPNLLTAVHKLRMMDANSVGRWARQAGATRSMELPSDMDAVFSSILRRYDYALAA